MYIYWDNSNIFIEAKRFTQKKNDPPDAQGRMRIDFDKLLRLAHADREVDSAFAAGSAPPNIKKLWDHLKNKGVEVQLFDRIKPQHGEKEIPDLMLQQRMLANGLNNIDTPGIAVLLTGDGAGYFQGRGFHYTLERLHKHGWQVEVLSWKHSCSREMRKWVEKNGTFIELDKFYESITFLEPSGSSPARYSTPLDLSKRL